MAYTEWTKSIELTSSPLSFTEVDRWLITAFTDTDSVPKTVRYRHHPRVGQSNPQQPAKRCHQLFSGHPFRVGRSKK